MKSCSFTPRKYRKHPRRGEKPKATPIARAELTRKFEAAKHLAIELFHAGRNFEALLGGTGNKRRQKTFPVQLTPEAPRSELDSRR